MSNLEEELTTIRNKIADIEEVIKKHALGSETWSLLQQEKNHLLRKENLLLEEKLKLMGSTAAIPPVDPIPAPIKPSPLALFESHTPSSVDAESIKEKQLDSEYYSPCSSLFALELLTIIYGDNSEYLKMMEDARYRLLLETTYQNFRQGMNQCDHDPCGYFSSKNLTEPGVTSIFTSNLNCLLIRYQELLERERDDRITVMHQSYATNERYKSGEIDTTIHFQFSSKDEYLFQGSRCLYPMAFLECTKSKAKSVEKKLPQSSLEANYLFRQMNYKIIDKTTPLLGITFSENDYVIKLYHLTLVGTETRIAEVVLEHGYVNGMDFLHLFVSLIFRFVESTYSMLTSQELKSPRFSLVPRRRTNTLKVGNYMYKCYDYRSVSNKSHILSEQRRSPTGYKHSKLGFEMVIDYHHEDHHLNSLQVIRYLYIEGSCNPSHVIHFLQIILEVLELHQKNLVFGDLRLSNMVFSPIDDHETSSVWTDSTIYARLIDFDMIGKEHEKAYPEGFNCSINDGKRCPDAVPGNLYKREHDYYSLASICNFYAIAGDHMEKEQNTWKNAIRLVEDGLLDTAVEELRGIYSCRLVTTNCGINNTFTGSPPR